MGWEDFSLEQCFEYACQVFGLEDQFTLAISIVLDTYHNNGMNRNNATIVARQLVKGGYDSTFFPVDDENNDGYWQVDD